MADITKRMNYFDHQFLREGDMNLQQDYHIDRHRRHNRLQHTWGVADGLAVEFVSGASSVTVRAGTAIDGEGREIILAADESKELSGVAADQDVYITITYTEELSDPTAETGAEGMTRWSEAPLVEASVSLPSNPEMSLVLAQVTRSGTTVSAVDNTVRTLAGVVGGDLEVSSLTFTDPGVIPAQWPSMHLGAAQRADVEGSLRISQNLIVDGTISGDIAVGSVQAVDLVNNAVTSAKLAEADGSSAQNTNTGSGVKTGHIQNGAITNAKVAAGSINHSNLNLDGGTNPHGTTAANVGALAVTGGTVNGNVAVNGQLSSLRTNTSTANYYGFYGSVNGNSTGMVAAQNLVTTGSGAGPKYGIYATTSGTGQKYGGYFYTTTSSGDNSVTYGVESYVVNSGNSVTYGMYSNSGGTGTGDKFGIQCWATGSGTKYGGYFVGSSNAGTNTTYGIYSRATGAGTGTKYGVYGYAEGAGPRFGGYFRSVTSSATETGYTYGSYNYGSSVGTGPVYGTYSYAYSTNTGTPTIYGVLANAYGAGTGTKYGIYAYAGGGGTSYAGYFYGNVHVTGTLSKGAGTFLIDHPLDPYNKTLRHNFVESPENLCLYRGKVKLDAKGTAKVDMPEYFAALTTEEEATVTLTSIGKKPFLVGYEWNKKCTAFTVYGEADGEVSYLVLADRDDPAMHLLGRPVEEAKGDGNFEKGKLLYPEAYNESPEKGVEPVPEALSEKEQIQSLKDVEKMHEAEEKARQAKEKAQDKLHAEMEKEEQKQQAAMAKEVEKVMKEQAKEEAKAGKKKKSD